MERLLGTAAPVGADPPAGETESPAQEAFAAKERLGGRVAPIGTGRPAGGTGSPARAWSLPKERLLGGSPHRPGPTSWGDGESCLGGCRCQWSAGGGRPG